MPSYLGCFTRYHRQHHGYEQPNYIDEEIAMPNMEGSQTLRAVADPGEGSPLVAVTNLPEAGQHIAVRCFTPKRREILKIRRSPCMRDALDGGLLRANCSWCRERILFPARVRRSSWTGRHLPDHRRVAGELLFRQ
jgi:hypothetical protein